MTEASLLVICATALGVVFTVLTVLAITIRVVTEVFPNRVAERHPDEATIASTVAAAAAFLPGARVSRIEEMR